MYNNNNLLIDCTGCRTPLQLPPGASSIRCAVCSKVSHVAPPQGGGYVQPVNNYHHAAGVAPVNNYHAGAGVVAPSPYNHAPGGPIPNVHGNKRAVLVGVSYKHSRNALKGCLNDAKCMRYMLINKFHFPEASIIMLNEEEADPSRIPTRSNIMMALNWLVQGCQAGDSLVFHFSGHGSQQRNYTGDEIDGYDETLCPVDFETEGMIVDDEINSIIVRPLPPGVKLHAIVDACHSGTVLDLPYLCRMNRSGEYMWEDHRPRSGTWKGTAGGEAISISGCDDNQTSADTSALSRVTSTGAMTFCFIQAIERSYGTGTTYGSLLNAMRTAIREAGNPAAGGGHGASNLVNMLVQGGSGGQFKQEPQLTSYETFDVYSKPFSL